MNHIEKVHYTLSNQNNVPDPYFGGKDGLFKYMRCCTKLVKINK